MKRYEMMFLSLMLITVIVLLSSCAFEEKIATMQSDLLSGSSDGANNLTYEPPVVNNEPIITLVDWPTSNEGGIQTTDIVEYVNVLTGEIKTGPSIGGVLDKDPDWEQVQMESLK